MNLQTITTFLNQHLVESMDFLLYFSFYFCTLLIVWLDAEFWKQKSEKLEQQLNKRKLNFLEENVRY